jgi:phosphoribosyl 1,2-cyclic phosphate phosphodiesterase
VEGFRVVEQITLDFRTWQAYSGKQIKLVLPAQLDSHLREIRSVYGPIIDFFESQGFVQRILFRDMIKIGKIQVTAIPVDRGSHQSFIYIFEKDGKRLIYAPCDIKPFPEERDELHGADLLVIQPGIFEDGLKHGFKYPEDHISRKTLYTFEETLALAGRIKAGRTLFVHIEEYWNRSHDDYLALQEKLESAMFAYDGMIVRSGIDY